MSFQVTAEAYAQFMGRYSEPLASQLVEWARLTETSRALDVGCGPGALTAELVRRLGPAAVTAVDPSAPFVAACQARFPGVDVQLGKAEQLPFSDDSFDTALAQLVVHFMTDPVAGMREMARVTRPGGVVAASVWDHAGAGGPLAIFWQAVHETDPDAEDEAGLAGTRAGHLSELATAAGWRDLEDSVLRVTLRFTTFEEWWTPFTLGVGPAGAYVASRSEAARDELERACARHFPVEPFDIVASAWCVRGSARGAA